MDLLKAAARSLVGRYGDRLDPWWPVDASWHRAKGSDPRFETMVGAVLAQNTAWNNAVKAIEGLRRADLLSIARLAAAPPATVFEAVRPAGFPTAKSACLGSLARGLVTKWHGDLDAFFGRPTSAVRPELLAIKGIGPETADSMLTYAGGHASFIIDAYTRRAMSRLGVIQGQEPYAHLQERWTSALAPDGQACARIHAAIIENGKKHCRTRRPVCAGCPLESMCPKVGVEADVYERATR